MSTIYRKGLYLGFPRVSTKISEALWSIYDRPYDMDSVKPVKSKNYDKIDLEATNPNL